MKICAFTGHRPKSFPWGYNESAPRLCTLEGCSGGADFHAGRTGRDGFPIWHGPGGRPLVCSDCPWPEKEKSRAKAPRHPSL